MQNINEATVELINLLKPSKGVPVNNPDRANELLNKGAVYNYQDANYKNSFLHSLAWHGLHEIMALLIERAQKEEKVFDFVNLANKEGCTPLHQAAYSDITDNARIRKTISLLVQSGAVLGAEVTIRGSFWRGVQPQAQNALGLTWLRRDIDQKRFFHLASSFFIFYNNSSINPEDFDENFLKDLQIKPKNLSLAELRVLLMSANFEPYPTEVINKIVEIEKDFGNQKWLIDYLKNEFESKTQLLKDEMINLKRENTDLKNEFTRLQLTILELSQKLDALNVLIKPSAEPVPQKTKDDMLGQVPLSSSIHRFKADVDNGAPQSNAAPDVLK